MLTREQLLNLVGNYFKQIDRMPNNTIEHKNLVQVLDGMMAFDIITNNECESILNAIEQATADHYNYFNQVYKFGDCRLEFAEIVVAVVRDIISIATFNAIL